MVDFDATFEEQILHIPQAEREAHIHHQITSGDELK
jgi:hypothetical protein